MPVDYSTLLYDPVYAELGVPAVIGTADITVIDDTRPKTQTSGNVEMRSVGPGAFARIPELAAKGIARDDYMDAPISFNGRTWAVRSYELRGSPNGEDVGEVRFLLKAVASSNGGPPPTTGWPPANAKIAIDLVGNRAWTEADGNVPVDTLLGSDPNTENAWGPTVYDPTKLTADGYVGPMAHGVGFIGEARTRITSEATLTFVLKQTLEYSDELLEGLGLPNFVVVSADGNDALEIDLNFLSLSAIILSWNGEPQITSPIILNRSLGVLNKTAVTITSTRFESAYNGSAPLEYTITEAGRPSSNPLVAALLDVATGGEAIQSITIYDPLPNTVGLSALSMVTFSGGGDSFASSGAVSSGSISGRAI